MTLDEAVECSNCGAPFDSDDGKALCPKPSPGKPLVDCGRGGHMFDRPVKPAPRALSFDEAVGLAEGFYSGRLTSTKTLRELLQFVLDIFRTQMPCGFDEPRVVNEPPASAAVEFDGCAYDPDEAIAIGAALVRAGLQAKGGE